MDMNHVRPSTPNTVLYNDAEEYKVNIKTTMIDGKTSSRPGTGSSLAPPPAILYKPPADTAVNVGGGLGAAGGVWTVEGDNGLSDHMGDHLDPGDSTDLERLGSEDDTQILLEKEFEDFYEDSVHKSAGPVVFVSKTLGMLPVIWTEDEEESECKSYFNLYTFVIFMGKDSTTFFHHVGALNLSLCHDTGWVGLSVVSALRMDRLETWPGDGVFTADNITDPKRFVSRASLDTYMAATWVSSLTTLLFGVFKCRSFAEVLFGLSETDAQLELREKHYNKIKRKSLYWLAFLLALMGLHGLAFHRLLWDAGAEDWILLAADVLAHATIFVLDLQFLHFSMVLCKRYRLVNKILVTNRIDAMESWPQKFF